jgi:hypothetical protein
VEPAGNLKRFASRFREEGNREVVAFVNDLIGIYRRMKVDQERLLEP